jgi:drug/metabolite transporter (DMT)-like permease
MLVALSFLWGCSYFLIEIALEGLPVMALVALRVGLAAIVLWVFVAFARAAPPRSPGVWLAFFVMGLLNNIVPFTLIVWGQTEISSSLAAILNATTPVFAVVVAGTLLHDEPVTRGKLAGVVLGLVGVAIMIGPEVLGELGDAALPQLAIVGAALSYALAGTFGRRFSRMGVKPVVTAAGQVTTSALLLLAWVAFAGPRIDTAAVPDSAWAAVVALAVFSTAVAYILYFRILAVAGATNLMLVTFLIPVTAILLGSTFLDERLAPLEIAGMVLIAAALVAIDGRALGRLGGKRGR